MVGSQPVEAGMAGLDRAVVAGIPGQDLRDEKGVFAPILQRFADNAFGTAIAIHLGRVDHRHAEIERQPDGIDFRLASDFVSPIIQVPKPSVGISAPPGRVTVGWRRAWLILLEAGCAKDSEAVPARQGQSAVAFVSP